MCVLMYVYVQVAICSLNINDPTDYIKWIKKIEI